MVHLINYHHLMWKSCKNNIIYNFVCIQDFSKLKSRQFSFTVVELYVVYWNKVSILHNVRKNNTPELTCYLTIKFPPLLGWSLTTSPIHLWGVQSRWKYQIESVATSSFVESEYLSWQGLFWAHILILR